MAGSSPGEGSGVAGSRKALVVRGVLALVLSVAITAVVVIYRDQLADAATYGYLGIFVVSLVGNATVVFPVPSLVTVFAGGAALNPLLVGLVAGVAEPLGELTGYLAGYGGSAIIENQKMYDRLVNWMERHGYLTVFILSAIPNPVFDLAGIAAGALRFPVWKFLLAAWMGKTIKTTLIAFAGAQSWELFQHLFR